MTLYEYLTLLLAFCAKFRIYNIHKVIYSQLGGGGGENFVYFVIDRLPKIAASLTWGGCNFNVPGFNV